MKKLFLILLFITGLAKAQNANLVPNYSFEDTIKCQPGNIYPFINNWYNPNQGTPDGYHICVDNFIPSQISDCKRHSGYARVGIWVIDSSSFGQNEREYVANKLDTNLIAGKKYCSDFYIIAAKNFRYGSDKFGIYFGIGSQNYSVGPSLIPVTPQLTLPMGTFVADTASWYHFSQIYIASGGETDIVIGNFSTDAQTNLQLINSYPSAPNGSYFIIDDVSLHEMSINAGNNAVTCPENMVATIGEINMDTAFKSYYWHDASGVLFDSISSQIQVQPTNSTFFVQEKRMCGQSVYDTVFVNVQTECVSLPDIELIIPNVFSPNEDAINDSWKVELPASNVLQSVEIYDRWGVKIVSTSDLTISQNDKSKVVQWFGRTTSGMACSEGVYYYTLKIKDSKGEVEGYKGYISLFR